MTLVAGIWHPGGRTLPDTVTSALNRALSRSAQDIPALYSAPGVHLAKVDIGAFGESACFALVHYTPADHRLLLATGQLGVRPLYYTAAGDWIAGSGRHGYAIAMARDLARWWERTGRRPVPIPADVGAPA